MFQQNSLSAKGRLNLLPLAILLTSTSSIAETFEFKVVYAQVPGIEKILAGDLIAAIAKLERRARDSNKEYFPDEMATLCALYVVTGQHRAGRETCKAAVEIDRSHAAYNNRGVFRAHQGDSVGALEDFGRARVRPEHEHRYIEELKRRDGRLMASRNFEVANAYIERRKNGKKRKAGSLPAASVEDLNH